MDGIKQGQSWEFSPQAREGTGCYLQEVGAALYFPKTIPTDTALSTSLGL